MTDQTGINIATLTFVTTLPFFILDKQDLEPLTLGQGQDPSHNQSTSHTSLWGH